jgi:hypothetical protein
VVSGDEITTTETKGIELNLSEGISAITLKVESEDGREGSDIIGLSMLPVVFDGEEIDSSGLSKVTIPGLNSCDAIPVVSVGGCLTGPFAMFFELVLGSTSEAITSTQLDAHATWQLGAGIIGVAPGTDPSEHGPGTSYTPPPVGGEHFTFFFDAPYNETSIISTGHHDLQSEQLAFTGHDITVTCNQNGKVVAIAHQGR